MNLSDFDYDLPETFIAQEPAEPRDSSRLMLLNRQTGTIEHRHFHDILAYLQPNDVLVVNNTRVIPARLQAKKAHTGGNVEILLLRQLDDTRWHVLAGGRRVEVGTVLQFADSRITAEV
ncbi:MAG TPA: S-adenosylmethionine:tRNA ribosyltransferase-isomerase, partial [Phototrophicaceae bacterium]|nr:S-adenosylmethionine:tRNA ribosyltransferase-isomerase [Phototrophicaceae bacterium]